jgi:hypothetical protein
MTSIRLSSRCYKLALRPALTLRDGGLRQTRCKREYSSFASHDRRAMVEPRPQSGALGRTAGKFLMMQSNARSLLVPGPKKETTDCRYAAGVMRL